MKYNLGDPKEAKEAFAQLNMLLSRKVSIELKRISTRRSLGQNAYLHLLISAFGNYFGYTPEEAKMVYKYLNADVYRYKRHGITFWRSSADLTKEEMTKTIEKFKSASAKQGYDLPDAENHEWIRQTQNELERSNYFTNAI